MIWISVFISFIANPIKETLWHLIDISLAATLFIMIVIVSRYSDYFVYMIPFGRIILSAAFLLRVMYRDKLDEGCDYKTISPVIQDEIFISFGFLIDTLFISASLKMTVFAFTPIYIANQYFHAKIVIEPGDTASFMMKGTGAVLVFSILFVVYYLVTM